MKNEKKFAKKLNSRFVKKQNELRRDPGVLGDGNSNLSVPGFDKYVYVTIGDKAIPIWNNRVAAQLGMKVWVGYAPEEPTLYQVLSTRSDTPAGVDGDGFTGYAPAKRYEWMAYQGGQDPLYVHLRAITPLRLGVSVAGGMMVNLLRGHVYTGTAYLAIARQDIDLTAHIPTTADKAALVLITISNTGTVVQTKGAEVDLTALALSDLPAIPASTVFICGAVRVYQGQTVIQEGRTNTDIVDLRFPGRGGTTNWADLIGKPTTWDILWAELTGATAGVQAIGDPRYPRIYEAVVPPTVNDDSGAGYKKGDIWIDTAGLLAYKAIDVTVAAAIWLPTGAGSDVEFNVDGALAVIASASVPFLVTKTMRVTKWYIYCETPGTASSTIVDIHKNGTTVFTTQGNRPTLAFDDADGWASGVPDIQAYVEGDVISPDIDQIATGAAGLMIIGLVANSSGGGGITVEESDGTPSVSNVGKIIVPNGLLTDNGGGIVTLRETKTARGTASVVHTAAQDSTVAVNFGTTFAAAPIVLVTTKDRHDMTFGAQSVTTTGFALGSRWIGGALSATVEYYWLAIEV